MGPDRQADHGMATSHMLLATGFLSHATGFLSHATGYLSHATGFLSHDTGFLSHTKLSALYAANIELLSTQKKLQKLKSSLCFQY